MTCNQDNGARIAEKAAFSNEANGAVSVSRLSEAPSSCIPARARSKEAQGLRMALGIASTLSIVLGLALAVLSVQHFVNEPVWIAASSLAILGCLMAGIVNAVYSTGRLKFHAALIAGCLSEAMCITALSLLVFLPDAFLAPFGFTAVEVPALAVPAMVFLIIESPLNTPIVACVALAILLNVSRK